MRSVTIGLLLLIISSFISPYYCQGALIKVYPSQNSIQDAINTAISGDTLYLQSGIYKEHDISVSKKLTIIGRDFPVIDGENAYGIFTISADSVTIQGLQIQNIGKSSINDLAGIKILNSAFAFINDNKLVNNTYGVYIQNSRYCIITNNLIQSNSVDELNSGNGIHGWKSDHLTIKNNNISGHRDGLYFEFVTESIIKENSSSKNVRYGLHFMFSHDDTYIRNLFSNNGAGVAVMYSHGVKMFGNTFEYNWGGSAYGLLLKEISDSYIYRNHFTKNTIGIFMEGTNRIYVWHNVFQNNGWAMHIQANCNGNDFEENNFIGNSFDVATNGTLMLSTFKRNFWDKYDGYDLNKDNIGDVPYYPVSIYSVIIDKIPTAMILYHSFLTDIMDKAETAMPSMIPDKLRDDCPVIKKWKL
jgi:nitrous oxidase accessory protein